MNCLYTVNINEFLSARSKESFLSACSRWGCDYSELRHEVVKGYPTCTKLCGARLLAGYEKLAYFDADMIIAGHAPNPFALCAEEHTLYAVKDLQSLTPEAPWREVVMEKSMQSALERYRWLKRPDEQKFFNSGFWMFYNSDFMRAMFACALGSLPDNAGPMQEQGTLNAVAHNFLGLKIRLLPETWNHMLAASDPDPQAYVNHFGGECAKQKLKALNDPKPQ